MASPPPVCVVETPSCHPWCSAQDKCGLRLLTGILVVTHLSLLLTAAGFYGCGVLRPAESTTTTHGTLDISCTHLGA